MARYSVMLSRIEPAYYEIEAKDEDDALSVLNYLHGGWDTRRVPEIEFGEGTWLAEDAEVQLIED